VSRHKHVVQASTLFCFYDDVCNLERENLIDKKGKKFLLTIKA
jgi:hypothetical protein